MSDDSDRESWSQVPDHPEYWASTLGRIAKVDPGGGFRPLVQRPNVYGLMTVGLKVDGGTKTVMVASLVLRAFGHPRPNGYRTEHRDGDPGNCTPGNLRWAKKGGEPARDFKERRCLGPRCNVMFSSTGAGNRLCLACTSRVGNITLSGFEGAGESSELPDEPLCGTGGNPHK